MGNTLVYTIPELAKRLGIAPGTTRGLVKEGKIPGLLRLESTGFRRKLLVSKVQVEAFLSGESAGDVKERFSKVSKYKLPNRGICCLCGESGLSKSMAEHFQTRHPEYKFTREKKANFLHGYSYRCLACNQLLSSFTELAGHYQRSHPECLTGTSNSPVEKVESAISQGDHSVEGIAGIIGGLNDMLRRVRDERDSLEAEVGALKEKYADSMEGGNKLAALLSESQQMMASENKRRG